MHLIAEVALTVVCFITCIVYLAYTSKPAIKHESLPADFKNL